MAVFNAAFPVLEGREDDARSFGKEALGSHGDHYNELMQESGTSRVTWTLQETPAGTMLLVWFEADDVDAIFEHMAHGSGPAVDWMHDRVLEVAGIDLREAPSGPPPEVIMEWPG